MCADQNEDILQRESTSTNKVWLQMVTYWHRLAWQSCQSRTTLCKAYQAIWYKSADIQSLALDTGMTTHRLSPNLVVLWRTSPDNAPKQFTLTYQSSENICDTAGDWYVKWWLKQLSGDVESALGNINVPPNELASFHIAQTQNRLSDYLSCKNCRFSLFLCIRPT